MDDFLFWPTHPSIDDQYVNVLIRLAKNLLLRNWAFKFFPLQGVINGTTRTKQKKRDSESKSRKRSI